MVVCKFFLQGTCKFGNNCKFEHTLSDPYHYTNPNVSVLRQQSQPNVFAQTQQKTVDTTALVKNVVTEATAAEKGGQWLLTCYAPFKEKPPFPGLEDTSFEEVRFGFYEAQKNGTLDQYMRQMQEMLQNRMMQLKSMQNPNQEMIALLKNIYDTPASTSFGLNQIVLTNRTGGFNQQGGFSGGTSSGFTQQSPFGGQTTGNSIFGNTAAAQSNSPFGQKSILGGAPNTSIFSQAAASNTSIFGGNQQSAPSNSPFGSVVKPTGSIFAQTTTTSPFGAPTTSNSPFGTAQSPSPFASEAPASNSPFGTAPQTSNSPFGTAPPTSNSPFGTAPNPETNSPFGGTFAQNNAGSIFGGQTQPGLFASVAQPPQQQPGMFQQTPQVQTQGSIFGQAPQQQQQQSQSMFGNTMETSAPSQPAQFPSGQSIMQPSVGQHSQNIFGGQYATKIESAAVDMTIYSKLEDLTPADINWFESDTLDIASIPEKPPTYEMCQAR